MTMSNEQIHALVFLARTTRPHGASKWDENGIASQVRKLADAGLSAQEVIHRTLMHAWDRKAKTPGVLVGPAPSSGLDQMVSNRVVYPVRAGSAQECPVHPGQRAAACSYCAADSLAGDGPLQVRREDPPSYDEAGHRLKHPPLRELFNQTKAELAPAADNDAEEATE